MRKLFYTLALLALTSSTVVGQTFGLASLFKPGMRVSGGFVPEVDLSDSLSMGFSGAAVTAVVPLKGDVSIDIKKLKASASAAFWTIGARARMLTFNGTGDGVPENRLAYTFGTGVTGVTAGTGRGVWAYSVNIGLLQDPGVKSTYQPYAAAGLLRVKIKGVHRQNFFGVGAAWNGRTFIPVPILGARRKLAKGMHVTVLLPIQADITWKPVKKFEIDLWNRLASFRTSFLYRPSVGEEEDRMLNYRSLNTSLVAQYKFSGKFKLIAEGGYSYLRNLGFETTDKEDIVEYTSNAVPYVRVSARLNFGSSPVASQLFGTDL